MEIANWLDFRFFFALGALPCYPWIAPKKSSEARLAAGLFCFTECNTDFPAWEGRRRAGSVSWDPVSQDLSNVSRNTHLRRRNEERQATLYRRSWHSLGQAPNQTPGELWSRLWLGKTLEAFKAHNPRDMIVFSLATTQTRLLGAD